MGSINEHFTTTVPQWLQFRYGQLWEKFSHNPFNREQATDTLKESKKTTNVILSILRKRGWISTAFDSNDFRKRVYKLYEPSFIFSHLREVDKNAQDK